MILHGAYDYRLVALSVVLAMFAAYAALDLAGRVTAAQRWARFFWLAGGAASMGMGIWAMHYIGMLAFNLPVPVLYHYPTVIISLLAAMAASAVALLTVSRGRMGVSALIVASLMMGSGIAGMHYIGMHAMRLPATMEYRWDRVALSAALAVAISCIALMLVFRVRQNEQKNEKTSGGKLLSALLMGSAIPLMHYTGMWAVVFTRSDIPFSTQATVRISSLGITVISIVSFLAMLLTIVTAFLDRLISMQRTVVNAARDGEARFRILAEAVPQIVWTALPEGAVDYVNQRWCELTGMGVEQSLGSGWQKALHPDDLPLALQNWEKSRETGAPFEMEYRLQNRAGGFRWHLVRGKPMLDSAGAIVRWFGACADIDDQMHTQEFLQQQVKEHTEALFAANTRLQEEMKERTLAQQELNQQNERMVKELTLRSQRATTLAKMAELLQSCAELKDVFSVVAGMSPKFFPELRGAILLLDSSGKTMELAGQWSGCTLSGSVFEAQDCWALRTGHMHFVTAGDRSAICGHVASADYSYFCLPLLSQGRAVGILHFQMHAPGELADWELSFATSFAEQVGLSIANIRLREALRNQSIRDPLTGLYNRRYLDEMMERETRRATRAAYSMGVLVLDLDHFKKFNDTYGHDGGDMILRDTASLLVKSVRVEDIVCRYGGEEFVIVLPMADLEISRARAERIRSRLRDLTVMHQGRPLGAITVSIGVAALPQNGTSSRQLLEAADAALYRAKREGRDRVVVAEAAAESESPDFLSTPETANAQPMAGR